MAARVNTNGILDAGFGTGGQIHTAIGSIAFATAATVQTDGRIVLAGHTKVSDQDVLAVARYYGDPAL
jgi:hypothetical protein